MMRRVLAVTFLASLLAESSAFAQLAPSGSHYAGRASDTGYQSVTPTGGFPTAVALEFPAARGGLGIPISLAHGRRGFGAGGVGWDVPLSFVRLDNTVARRRPARLPGAIVQPRERLIVSVAGRTVEMTQSGDVWLARRDAPDWELRELSDSNGGTWHLRDGSGQHLVFSKRPELLGAPLWLLSSASTETTSNNLDLDYRITTHSLDGGDGFEINLLSAKYNSHPNTPGCTKNEIVLDYNEVPGGVQSISLMGDLSIVRTTKVWQIRVLARENCTSSPVTLHRYLLDYANDPDTGQFRLSGARVLGRAGTAEENVSLPLASYGYGAATSNGKLEYKPAADIAFPSEVGTIPPLARTYRDSSTSSPDGGKTYVDWQNLIDVSGDGRPDLLFKGQWGPLRVAINRPGLGGASFTALPTAQFTSSLYPAGPLVSRSSETLRYDDAWQTHDQVWRQTVDVNGDGRLDIIDATEEKNVWTVYLNTPGSPFTWVKRRFRVDALRNELEKDGHVIEGDHVPLSRRTTGFDLAMSECWEWNSSTNRYVQISWDQEKCGVEYVNQKKVSGEKTFTEWELRDVNGDGYPDFVFNSSPIRNVDWNPCEPGYVEVGCHRLNSYQVFLAEEPLIPSARDNNSIKALLNVVGVMFVDEKPFSAPVTLMSSICGVAKWTSGNCPNCSPPQASDRQWQACGLEDVNGDGIADRIEGRDVRLGTGDSFGLKLQLPNVPEQQNPHNEVCTGSIAGTPYEPIQVRGLRDLTGDGIPDFIEKEGGWRVWIGTGASFKAPIAIDAPSVGFSISNTKEACASDDAATLGGLYDIDGDGKPEVLQVLHNPARIEVYRLTSEVPGNPQAGRLTSIDNGYGAITNITYRSAKEDVNTSHQVPFPEIVVTAVETTGTYGRKGTLAPVRYAYGDAEQFYDPFVDAFTMRAYGRTVEVHGKGRENWDAAYAIVRDTYRLPQFIAGMSDADRFERYQKAGRISDTYVLGNNVEGDPWELLRTFDPYTDLRRVSGTHQQWATRYTPLPQYSNWDDCKLVDDPYNWTSSLIDQSCEARGFSYVRTSDSWSGTQAPGSSASNVETRVEVVSVDEVGNVTELRNENDRHDPTDDICVLTDYAKQTTEVRILSAVARRRVTNCVSGKETQVFSLESWEFDELPVGYVGRGRVTSRITERHATDDGQFLDPIPIREYEIGYDSVGNPVYIVSAREDGAVRTVKLTYEEFGLAPTSSTIDASGIAPFTVESTLDRWTLALDAHRDANGTVWGSVRDGFGRTTQTTVKTPGGEVGVLATVSYEATTQGRSIRTKSFTDPVSPGSVGATQGQETVAWLDELGRPFRAVRDLGEDYKDRTLVVLSRKYDELGRISFDADPHPSSQDSETAYGTSFYFDTIGALACSIRGHGPQPLTFSTDLKAEILPTCFTRTYSDHKLQTSISTPDSLDVGTPQTGTIRTDTTTAIGRLLTRETWKDGARLEASQYTYDRIGQLASLTRFGNPGASPAPLEPVVWTWRHDSRGQTIYATEPAVADRWFTYSNWGEPVATNWIDAAGITFSVESSYDALGRIAHSQELRGGSVIPETEYDWTYDIGEKTQLLTPTFTVGRLTKTHSLAGDMHVSYDAFGNVNGRAFTRGNEWYGERHELHADGSPSALEFSLPDNKYEKERYEYAYDSASRVRSVVEKGSSGDTQLYAASTIDVWGRLRAATYGEGTKYEATYAEFGPRLMLDETVTTSNGYRRVEYKQRDAAGRELERYEVNPDKLTTLNVYDAIGRLVRSLDGLHGSSFDRRFTYDALGNLRQSRDMVSTEQTNLTYTSTDPDRICRIDYGAPVNGPCNVDHDGSGNVVGQPTPAAKNGDPPTQRDLTFYPSGSVSRIEQDGNTANFLYDGSGQILALDVSGPFLSDARRDYRFGLVEQREIDGAKGPESIIERHIPGPGGIVASRRGAGKTFIYPFADNRGTRTTTDGKDFVQDVTYQPFGKATSSGPAPRAAEHTHYQWNGGDALADLGLVHLGARLYDPNIGRFLSRDPLIVVRSASMMNPYGFALNDPINFSDPTGLDCAESLNPCAAPILLPPLDFGSDSNGPASAALDIGPKRLPREDAKAIAEALRPPPFVSSGDIWGDIRKVQSGLMRPPLQSSLEIRIGGVMRAAGGIGATIGLAGFCVASVGLGCGVAAGGAVLTTDEAAAGVVQAATGEHVISNFERAGGPLAGEIQRAFTGAMGLATSVGMAQVGSELGAANVAAAPVPSTAWSLNPFARGVAIENALGRNLPGNFPVIDRFLGGVVTSIKSIDLGAKTYQNLTTLGRTVTGYINKVKNFNGRTWAGAEVDGANITGRALELAVPLGGVSLAQQAVLDAAVIYGQSIGVQVIIIPL